MVLFPMRFHVIFTEMMLKNNAFSTCINTRILYPPVFGTRLIQFSETCLLIIGVFGEEVDTV